MYKYLRWLLLPFSLIYGLIVIIRNWCYDAGLFKSQSFDIPVISVGNLDVGGAGKSPMTEYLVRLLLGEYKLATLSRGYGRDTKGFLVADESANMATKIGDEPAQFKHKFHDVTVAVCEKRVTGIENLKQHHDLVILDDAYQHRAVKPGLSILLFDYGRINEPHFLLPAGNLREPFSGRKRADVIVITKCTLEASTDDLTKMGVKVKPYLHQKLFYTGITYSALQKLNGEPTNRSINNETVVFLLTGIANAEPLLNHVKKLAKLVIHHNYPDHHQFTLKNIAKLAEEFNASGAQNKLIITTEKDAQRLGLQALANEVKSLGILVMPIEIKFLANGQQQFDQIIKNYVRQY